MTPAPISRTTTARAGEAAAARLSSIAFFDGIGAAHSLPLITGLDEAAARAGINRQWTTAIRPPAAGAEDCEWTATRAFYAEFCESGRFPLFAYRVACQRAIERARAGGAGVFCDLAVEQLTASFGPPLRVGMPAVWIAHQPPAPRDTRPWASRTKVLLANPRRWRREPRTAHARSVLRHLARTGGRFVVPSVPARDRLARTVDPDLVHVVPWPIVSEAAPPGLATGTPGEVVAIMPGEARVGKGLDLFLTALTDVADVSAVDFPIVATDEAENLIRATGDARIRAATGWMPNDEYQRRLRAATLAVLPYRSSAAANGGISASLLDAMAIGLPAVVTQPIARVLPPGYGGAVVVAPDSPSALAAGISRAVANIDDLTARARAEGPAYVLAHHTYERYLQSIVEVGSA